MFGWKISWDRGNQCFLLLLLVAAWVLLEQSSTSKFHSSSNWNWGLPGRSKDEEFALWETWDQSLGQELTWRRSWQPT